MGTGSGHQGPEGLSYQSCCATGTGLPMDCSTLCGQLLHDYAMLWCQIKGKHETGHQPLPRWIVPLLKTCFRAHRQLSHGLGPTFWSSFSKSYLELSKGLLPPLLFLSILLLKLDQTIVTNPSFPSPCCWYLFLSHGQIVPLLIQTFPPGHPPLLGTRYARTLHRSLQP